MTSLPLNVRASLVLQHAEKSLRETLPEAWSTNPKNTSIGDSNANLQGLLASLDNHPMKDGVTLSLHIITAVYALKEICRSYRKTHHNQSASSTDKSNLINNPKAMPFVFAERFTSEVAAMLISTFLGSIDDQDTGFNSDQGSMKQVSAPVKSQIQEDYLLTARLIFSLFPQMATNQSLVTGKTLLHHASTKGTSFAEEKGVELLLQLSPQLSSLPDRTGMLPLHFAVRNPNASLPMVQKLVQHFPDGIKCKDNKGFLPLHHAVIGDTKFNEVSSHPNALVVSTMSTGQSASNHNRVEVVSYLLSQYPKAVKTVCSKGRLPLHVALSRPMTSQQIVIVDSLLDAYTEGTKVPCEDGWLPLHRYVNRQSPVDLHILNRLIDCYPMAVQCPNNGGQLPLHRAVDQRNPSRECVEILISRFPSGAGVADKEGYLPLHIALDNDSPNVEIALSLLKVHSLAVSRKTRDGALPLHIILGCHRNVDTNLALIVAALHPSSIHAPLYNNNSNNINSNHNSNSNSALDPGNGVKRVTSASQAIQPTNRINNNNSNNTNSNNNNNNSNNNNSNNSIIEGGWTPWEKAKERGLQDILTGFKKILENDHTFRANLLKDLQSAPTLAVSSEGNSISGLHPLQAFGERSVVNDTDDDSVVTKRRYIVERAKEWLHHNNGNNNSNNNNTGNNNTRNRPQPSVPYNAFLKDRDGANNKSELDSLNGNNNGNLRVNALRNIVSASTAIVSQIKDDSSEINGSDSHSHSNVIGNGNRHFNNVRYQSSDGSDSDSNVNISVVRGRQRHLVSVGGSSSNININNSSNGNNSNNSMNNNAFTTSDPILNQVQKKWPKITIKSNNNNNNISNITKVEDIV